MKKISKVSLWTTLFLKWIRFNKLFCLSKLSLWSWAWFWEKFMKWSWEWGCIFTLHQQGAPRVLTYNESGLCCEDAQPWSFRGWTDWESGCRVYVIAIALVLYSRLFWSIMRTWLRDMFIVIFCLGDVALFYFFHSFRKMLFEIEWVK